MNNIAIIIKSLIDMHELSQSAFSIKTGIPLITVRKYLNSEFNPTKKNIEKINETFLLLIEDILQKDYKLNSLLQIEELIFKIKEDIRDYTEELEQLNSIKKRGFKNINKKEKFLKYSRIELENENDIENWIAWRTWDKERTENNLKLINFILKETRKNTNEKTLILDNNIKNTIKLLSSKDNIIDIKNNNINIENETGIYNLNIETFNKIIEVLQDNLNNDFINILKLLNNE